MNRSRIGTILTISFFLIASLVLPLYSFIEGYAQAFEPQEDASWNVKNFHAWQPIEEGQLQGRATNTPRPTSTPVPIPPPADPISMNFLAAFGILAAVVVLIGLWLHRGRAT